MTTKAKVLLIFGIFFVLALFSIIGSAAFMFFVTIPNAGKRAVELNQKRSAETFGTITSYSEYRTSGDKYRGSSINSTYTFQYEVNGVSYENTQSWGGEEAKKKDTKVKVCFDPADPKSSQFYLLKDNKTCGK